MASFERILVPTDFSAGSYAALGYATFLARRLGSTLEVVAVAEAPVGIARDATVTLPGHTPLPLDAALRTSAEEKLRNFLSDVPGAEGIEIAQRVEIGHPADAIVRVAKEDGIDLIAMGTRGINAGGPLGSVVDRVIRDAPCPVMAVRVKQA